MLWCRPSRLSPWKINALDDFARRVAKVGLGKLRCRLLGSLSFSTDLLDFPILFTMVCVAFTSIPAASIVAVFAQFLALALLTAFAFEHLIDRPAVAFSRRARLIRLQAA